MVIFINMGKAVANINELDAANIKYNTCRKLKYPPNIFSSLFILKGTLNILIN